MRTSRAASLAMTLVALTAGCTSAPATLRGHPFADHLLSDNWFTTLVIEIDHDPDYPPSAVALEELLKVARAETVKDGVTLEVSPFSQSAPNETWSVDDLVWLHELTLDGPAPIDAISAGTHVAYLHVLWIGGYGEDRNLGESRGDWIVIFAEAIQQSVANILLPTEEPRPPAGPDASRVERAVLIHEFGHSMGLVNGDTPMVRPHNDPDDPVHSNNPDSVMSTIDTIPVLLDLVERGESIPYHLDADDKADLAAGRQAFALTPD